MPGLVGISQEFITAADTRESLQAAKQVSPANSSFESNVMLIKDNDIFEEMIETHIELDFVQQPQRSFSYSSSYENLSASSDSPNNKSFEESNNE